MKEKIVSFFQNEKVKGFGKKVFNKRNFIVAIVIVVLVVALRVVFSLLFEVEGTVSKVDGSQITVANFFTTKTVDVGSFQTAAGSIQVGDRIEITKNLSGDVINVRDRSAGRMNGKNNSFKGGKQGFKGNGSRNGARRK